NSSCYRILQRNLYRTSFPCGDGIPIPIPGICNLPIIENTFDAEGFYWANKLMNRAFEKFQRQGFQIGSLPSSVGYNYWQDFIYQNVCCPYAGLCQDALQSSCKKHSLNSLSYNVNLTKWCGCHLNSNEYQEY